MRFVYSERFRRAYRPLPVEVQDQVNQQLAMLLANPRHPSLHFKKMPGTRGIWEVRITKSYRVTLQIEGDIYLLRNVGPHDILKYP